MYFGLAFITVITVIMMFNKFSFFAVTGTFLGATILLIVLCGDADVKPKEQEIQKHRENFKSEYEAYEKWERTFACTSCGSKFLPIVQAE